MAEIGLSVVIGAALGLLMGEARLDVGAAVALGAGLGLAAGLVLWTVRCAVAIASPEFSAFCGR